MWAVRLPPPGGGARPAPDWCDEIRGIAIVNVVFIPIIPRAARIARLTLPGIGVLCLVAAHISAHIDRDLVLVLLLAGIGCLGTGFVFTLQIKKIEFFDDRWIEHHYNFLQNTTYYRDVVQIGRLNIRATNWNLAFYNLENQSEWEAMVAHLAVSGRLPNNIEDVSRSP
jgi:hypothetical protein